MELVDVVGVICSLFSFFLQISPLPGIYKGLKEMEIKSMTLFYFFMGVLQSVLWATFGLKKDDFYVTTVNGIGVTLFLIYMNIFIFISGIKQNYIYTDGLLIFIFLFVDYEISVSVNLTIAVIVSSAWQATTIPTMQSALANKDSSFVNILLMYVSFGNFVAWIIYGVMVINYPMAGQNVISATFCFMNINIYHWAQGQLEHNNFFIQFLKVILRVHEETPGRPIDQSTPEKIELVNK